MTTKLPLPLPHQFPVFHRISDSRISATTSLIPRTLPSLRHRHRHRHRPFRATENGAQTDSNTPTPPPPDDIDDVGAELKNAMKDRRESSGNGGGDNGGFWGGVVEEIGMIEWPEFGKVLGTTAVVLAVIVASSVVLLSLNAALAELSDRVFVGKGVQDFFGG
ncbi:hypothetical protein vseg_012158 [Gypsophila vaccaria]